MYKQEIKPYGEIFAENVALPIANLLGVGVVLRLDASQGATGVAVVVSKGSEVTIPAGDFLRIVTYRSNDLSMTGDKAEVCGYKYARKGVAETFKEGEVILVVNFTNVRNFDFPYKQMALHAPTSTGMVDVFPVYLSKPRRK
jgi:hypothetical protein